jgi:hypothetical protein
MSQPVEEVRGEGAGEVRIGNGGWNRKQRIFREGKLPNSVARVRVLLYRPVQRVLREAGRPRFVEPLLEGTTLVGPSIVVVAGGYNGRNAREVGDGRLQSAFAFCTTYDPPNIPTLPLHPAVSPPIPQCRSHQVICFLNGYQSPSDA